MLVAESPLAPLCERGERGDFSQAVRAKHCPNLIWTDLDYAFDALHLHTLTAGCYAANHGSIKAFQHVGFVVEGVRKQRFYYGGSYIDEVLL